MVVDGVVKRYGPDTVLDRVSLSVAAGQVMVVIGPSGSGKSTLLRCIARLEPIQRGRILIDGVLASRGTEEDGPAADAAALRGLRHDVGMVFQSFNLFPHLTVLENITLAPRRVRGLAPADADAQAMELLQRVGLADKRDAYPARLSGGQQQRAAIARALAMRPRIMLFDEVTSALDPELVGEVLQDDARARRAGHDHARRDPRDGLRVGRRRRRRLHGPGRHRRARAARPDVPRAEGSPHAGVPGATCSSAKAAPGDVRPADRVKDTGRQVQCEGGREDLLGVGGAKDAASSE